MTFPLTLGIVREGPCRKLAAMAVERFETLGLWRQATPGAIKVAISMYFIFRCKLKVSLERKNADAFVAISSPELSRPFANTAVHLMRQYFSSIHQEDEESTRFAVQFGPLVLLADARCAAETGTRPGFTIDDLEDIPALRDWLSVPLSDAPMPDMQRLQMLNAGLLRFLRSFAADYHRRKSNDTCRVVSR